MNPLPCERGKGTFRHRIIEAIPWATHASLDPMVCQKLLEVRTGELTALIDVKNEAGKLGCPECCPPLPKLDYIFCHPPTNFYVQVKQCV